MLPWLALAFAGPTLAQAPTEANLALGTTLFGRDCASCHAPLDNARAPSLQILRTLTPGAVLTALTSGRMADQGAVLSQAEREALAEFIAGRALADTTATLPVATCSETSSLRAALAAQQWNGWGADAGNARFQSDVAAGFNAADIPRLELAWAFGFPDAPAARTQPTVIGDWLFTAGESGMVYALDARSGCARWTFQAGAAVRTAMSVVEFNDAEGDPVLGLLFGDGQAQAYLLAAETGELRWMREIDAHSNAAITAAPAVHDGMAFFATSAAGEEVRGQNPDYACCSFRGSVSALALQDGEALWKTHAITMEPAPRGTSEAGVQLLGPAGAGIWGSPTIDAKRGVLYVGTGNGFAGPAQPTTNAIIAMDLRTGAQRWVRQTVPGDIWLWQCDAGAGRNPNCPATQGPDFDFGASPVLTVTPSGRELLVVPQKSGMVYALDPDADGALVWEYRIGVGSSLGGQWGLSSDGRRAYVGVADTLSAAPGGMHAIELETGARAWYAPPSERLCDASEANCYAAQGGAVTAISGAVFSGGSDGGLRAYSTEDGSLLWEYDTNRWFETVNGVIAKGATMDAAGPVISGGMLFVNSGYNGIVGRAGNVLLAFRVSGTTP